METTAPQIYIFMIMLYGGVFAGIVYDVYRCIRKVTKRGRWITVLLDVLFIVTLGLIVLAAMYIANQGELRLFSFLGFALGFALYMAGISLFLHYLIKKIKNRIDKKRAQKKNQKNE